MEDNMHYDPYDDDFDNLPSFDDDEESYDGFSIEELDNDPYADDGVVIYTDEDYDE